MLNFYGAVNLLGVSFDLSSIQTVSMLLLAVIALLILQIVIFSALIVKFMKKNKAQTVVVKEIVQQAEASQPVEEKPVEQAVEEKPQAVEEVAQPVEEQVDEVEEPVEETPVEEEQEEQTEEEVEEEEPQIEEVQEEELPEEEPQVEEEVASAVAEEIVEEEIDDEEEEEDFDEDEEEDEEDDEEEEEDEEIGEIEIGGKSYRPKYAYPTRIKLVSDKVKDFYTDIKNEFLSYGIKSRISKTKENFNFSRDNVARFVVRGKTLKLYIAIDPSSIDHAYFHHKDVSEKKTYFDIPTMMPIKSRLASVKARELVAMLAEQLGLHKKRRFQNKDFSADLSAEGLTYVDRKGYGYLVKPSVTLADVTEIPDELSDRLSQVSKSQNKINRFIRTKVAVDVLAEKFQDGETVTIETVRTRGIGAPNANCLIVEDGETLDKKLTVYAEEFSPNAIKMIALCGGEVFKIERD
jgi:chemotaxis protein histidine kinase CheA